MAEITTDEEQMEGNVDIQKDVRILNSVLADWVYLIPDFKYEDLTKKLENITTSKEMGTGTRTEQPVNTLNELDFPQE